MQFPANHPIVTLDRTYYHALSEVPDWKIRQGVRYVTRSELESMVEWQTPCGRAARDILRSYPYPAFAIGSSSAFAIG